MLRFIFTFIYLVIFSGHSQASSETTKEQHKGTPDWAYSGSEGPSNWGSLSASFIMCNEGKQQSPIDINVKSDSEYYDLSFHYWANDIQLINNGHTIQNNYHTHSVDKFVHIGKKKILIPPILHYNSYLSIGPQKYNLLQFHFHTPSEHAVNGERAPIEIHLVHQNSVGALAVIGILVQAGKHNETLQQVLDNMPRNAGEHTDSTSQLNATALLPDDKTYTHYLGSLTTPPCSEDVKWFVLKSPIQASQTQIQQLSSVLGHNARPLQKQNWRSLLSVSQ